MAIKERALQLLVLIHFVLKLVNAQAGNNATSPNAATIGKDNYLENIRNSLKWLESFLELKEADKIYEFEKYPGESDVYWNHHTKQVQENLKKLQTLKHDDNGGTVAAATNFLTQHTNGAPPNTNTNPVANQGAGTQGGSPVNHVHSQYGNHQRYPRSNQAGYTRQNQGPYPNGNTGQSNQQTDRYQQSRAQPNHGSNNGYSGQAGQTGSNHGHYAQSPPAPPAQSNTQANSQYGHLQQPQGAVQPRGTSQYSQPQAQVQNTNPYTNQQTNQQGKPSINTQQGYAGSRKPSQSYGYPLGTGKKQTQGSLSGVSGIRDQYGNLYPFPKPPKNAYPSSSFTKGGRRDRNKDDNYDYDYDYDDRKYKYPDFGDEDSYYGSQNSDFGMYGKDRKVKRRERGSDYGFPDNDDEFYTYGKDSKYGFPGTDSQKNSYSPDFYSKDSPYSTSSNQNPYSRVGYGSPEYSRSYSTKNSPYDENPTQGYGSSRYAPPQNQRPSSHRSTSHLNSQQFPSSSGSNSKSTYGSPTGFGSNSGSYGGSNASYPYGAGTNYYNQGTGGAYGPPKGNRYGQSPTFNAQSRNNGYGNNGIVNTAREGQYGYHANARQLNNQRGVSGQANNQNLMNQQYPGTMNQNSQQQNVLQQQQNAQPQNNRPGKFTLQLKRIHPPVPPVNQQGLQQQNQNPFPQRTLQQQPLQQLPQQQRFQQQSPQHQYTNQQQPQQQIQQPIGQQLAGQQQSLNQQQQVQGAQRNFMQQPNGANVNYPQIPVNGASTVTGNQAMTPTASTGSVNGVNPSGVPKLTPSGKRITLQGMAQPRQGQSPLSPSQYQQYNENMNGRSNQNLQYNQNAMNQAFSKRNSPASQIPQRQNSAYVQGAPSNTGPYQGQAQPNTGQYQRQAQPNLGKFPRQAQPNTGKLQGQAQQNNQQYQGQAQPKAGQYQGQAQPKAGQFQRQAQPYTGKFQGQAQPNAGQFQRQARPNNQQFQGQVKPNIAQYQGRAQPNPGMTRQNLPGNVNQGLRRSAFASPNPSPARQGVPNQGFTTGRMAQGRKVNNQMPNTQGQNPLQRQNQRLMNPLQSQNQMFNGNRAIGSVPQVPGMAGGAQVQQQRAQGQAQAFQGQGQNLRQGRFPNQGLGNQGVPKNAALNSIGQKNVEKSNIQTLNQASPTAAPAGPLNKGQMLNEFKRAQSVIESTLAATKSPLLQQLLAEHSNDKGNSISPPTETLKTATPTAQVAESKANTEKVVPKKKGKPGPKRAKARKVAAKKKKTNNGKGKPAKNIDKPEVLKEVTISSTALSQGGESSGEVLDDKEVPVSLMQVSRLEVEETGLIPLTSQAEPKVSQVNVLPQIPSNQNPAVQESLALPEVPIPESVQDVAVPDPSINDGNAQGAGGRGGGTATEDVADERDEAINARTSLERGFKIPEGKSYSPAHIHKDTERSFMRGRITKKPPGLHLLTGLLKKQMKERKDQPGLHFGIRRQKPVAGAVPELDPLLIFRKSM